MTEIKNFNQYPFVEFKDKHNSYEDAKKAAIESFIKQLGHLTVHISAYTDRRGVSEYYCFRLRDFLEEKGE